MQINDKENGFVCDSINNVSKYPVKDAQVKVIYIIGVTLINVT